MPQLAERAYFHLCSSLGWLLRSARYSRTRLVRRDGELVVLKHRVVCAPLLIRMGGGLMSVLGTGVRILPQREWEERERALAVALRNTSTGRTDRGELVLPHLAGETFATLLEKAELDASNRKAAIELAVLALADFHYRGFTHGDAMAENVMVDLGSGVAHWFDFETDHDQRRSMSWRRADDVRALLVTCLLRTTEEDFAATCQRILDVYADDDITRLLAASFASAWRRPLAFHLGQAGLSHHRYREIGRLLNQRLRAAR